MYRYRSRKILCGCLGDQDYRYVPLFTIDSGISLKAADQSEFGENFSRGKSRCLPLLAIERFEIEPPSPCGPPDWGIYRSRKYLFRTIKLFPDDHPVGAPNYQRLRNALHPHDVDIALFYHSGPAALDSVYGSQLYF